MLRGRRWYLLLAMAPLLVAFAAAWFVIAVDPYDLRPWGAKIVLTDEIYPETVVLRLATAAAKGGMTDVVAGGSSVQRIGSKTMRSAFGADARPFNLSFAGIKPADLSTVLDQLLSSPTIKRVVATIDGTMLSPADHHRSGFPAQNFDLHWWDIAVDLNLVSVLDSAIVLRFGKLKHVLFNGRDRISPYTKPLPLRPTELKALSQAVEKYRAIILRPTTRTCDQIEAISKTFRPVALAYSMRGVALDLLIPPYALASYADRYARRFETFGDEPPAGFANLMLLRRCVVEAVADLPHVHVHGFDNDEGITGDLMNYTDLTHIQNDEVYEKILKGIVAKTNVVTLENWPEYERTLASRVKALRIAIP